MVHFAKFVFFLSSKFRKIKISRDSGGARSSGLDMFYPKDVTFDFLREKLFSKFFSSKKKSAKKKSIFFSRKF